MTKISRGIEIIRAAAPAMIQDGGRVGHMHQGVPVGGALVLERLALANETVQNPANSAAIEFYGRITIRARGDLQIAIDATLVSLRDGQDLEVAVSDYARVGYVAVRGGLDVPEVLGGRGTLGAAGLGGFEGRLLRRGDIVPVGEAEAVGPQSKNRQNMAWNTYPIRVLAGPDRGRFTEQSYALLWRETFVIDMASDRVGLRLNGPPIPRSDHDGGTSQPMVRGAIQVPGNGQLVVLGPDHPTTGGYPVIATVIRADQGALALRRSGVSVRFREVTLTEARAQNLK